MKHIHVHIDIYIYTEKREKTKEIRNDQTNRKRWKELKARKMENETLERESKLIVSESVRVMFQPNTRIYIYTYLLIYLPTD